MDMPDEFAAILRNVLQKSKLGEQINYQQVNSNFFKIIITPVLTNIKYAVLMSRVDK